MSTSPVAVSLHSDLQNESSIIGLPNCADDGEVRLGGAAAGWFEVLAGGTHRFQATEPLHARRHMDGDHRRCTTATSG